MKALPELFGFPSSPHMGIIGFTDPAVVQRVQTVLDEISAVFPSPYVHIGGDEVNFGALAKVPEVAAAIKAQGLNSTADLYRGFIAEMDAYAVSRNKTLHVWEGFAPQGGQTGRSTQPASSVAIDPKSGITVQPFDCFYYPPPQLAADGYKIINSAWSPLYIAGGAGSDPEYIYRWHPWLFGEVHSHLSWWEVPRAARAAVVGVEMAVWQTSASATLSALAQRVPAMADRSWNPAAMRTYADFQQRARAADRLLQALLADAGPPSPTPAPPTPTPGGAFSAQHGACRDAQGAHAQRIEVNGAVQFSACRDRCLALGERCDAYDIDGAEPAPGADPVVGWCGIWGQTLTAGDASGAFTFADDGTGGRVCRGDPAAGRNNTCYRRPPLC